MVVSNCCQQCYHHAVVATGLMPPPHQVHLTAANTVIILQPLPQASYSLSFLCQFQEGVVSTRSFKINIIFMLFGVFYI